MSEIKTLDKLRIEANNNPAFSDNATRIVNKYLDAIESEITDCYMPLPVDADGVPIHIDDVLECDANGYKGTFTVFAVGYKYAIGDHEIEWIRDNPDKWFHFAAFCHHVKPRTLKDVLHDVCEAVYFEGYNDGTMGRGAHIDETDWQTIADELNATLGSGKAVKR